MVKTIERVGLFAPAQLMDELTAQIPSFERKQGRATLPESGTVETYPDEGRVVVTFDDSIPEALVVAVLDAHVPVPVVPRDWAAELDSAQSVDDLKMWLQAFLKP